MSTLDACTIVSENYLPFARVLADSFLKTNPEGRFFVLLVGRVAPHIDASAEPFEIIEVESLENLPELRAFLFKYTILECNTAVKPYFLEHLFRVEGARNLAYFDPDIQIFRSLAPLAERLDGASIVLTPHLTAPLDDGMFPDELAILRAGAYNLGFIGLRPTESTFDFLRWWQERMFDRCVVRPEQGLFVDQKWVDLVPSLFEGVEILQDPGYNVAYWNLAHREVTLEPQPSVNGEPLYFFHFSGIQPDSMEMVSSHQDRFRFKDLGEVARLYEAYRDRLYAAGYKTSITWPYAFADFDNGTPIPDLARSLFLGMASSARRFGDPFSTTEADCFFAYLNEPASGHPHPPYLSRLVEHLYNSRPDLHRRFPHPAGADLEAFLRWLALRGVDRHHLASVFLEPGLDDQQPTLEGPRRKLSSAASEAWTSNSSRRVKQWAKRWLGPERTARLQEKIRPKSTVPALVEDENLPEIRSPGINLVGYLEAESGMGQAARALASAVEAAQIPLSLQNLDLNVLARQQDSTIGPAKSDFPWDINLVVVNADQVEPVRAHLGAHRFRDRYNIGYWLWELDRFPTPLVSSFQRFHEIWTPSSFCLDTLSSVSPIPVRRVPLPTEPPATSERGRAHFDLPEDRKVFLFVFDFLSYPERKNPWAVIEAFRRAFGDSEEVLLVLKASHTHFDETARLRIESASEPANIRWMPKELDRAEVDDLIRLCDCYVSLHRSEGFGLTLAEALSFDRPVISTDYSGSTDLVPAGAGLTVPFDLVSLERDVGPYEAGSRWADPDVEAAAKHMCWVFENPGEAAALGRRGGRRIRSELSPASIGELVRERFERILATSPGPQVGGPGPG